ncbi:MAG TPA: RidA family protein [bacterium]|nr:RidA family protein [bacterium]HPN35986.1 RidA family protein [bacterium]
MHHIIQTAQAPAAVGPYSQAIHAATTHTIYTAGQLGLDPQTGNLVEGGVEAQTRQALHNLQAILEAAGASMRQVVKTVVFLKNMDDFASMNQVYAAFFPEQPPARSTIEVARLPKNGLVEVEAVAVIE